MDNKSKIVKDIAIGAAVGAAVTMLRKENREKLASNARIAKTKMIEIREQAAPLKDRVVEGMQTVGAKSREMADMKTVKEKVDEIRKLTPVVVETIKETRELFNKKKQELKESAVQEQQEQVMEEVAVEQPQLQIDEAAERVAASIGQTLGLCSEKSKNDDKFLEEEKQSV